MDVVLTVLLVVNLVAVVAVLLAVLLRRGASPAFDTDAVARALRDEQQAGTVALRQELQAQRVELGSTLRAASEAQAAELAREREARAAANQQLREEMTAASAALKQVVDGRLDTIRAGTEGQLDKMRATLAAELEKLRQGNEAKLEKMRETVDEKLQGTLEKRLGESFSLVSERLEQVQKGLGEMQTLASDVGGLKRVLTNVKSRGGWGEVQLHRQLEDMLTPDQYAENVAVLPGSSERVEFAVRLPGRGDDDQPVWLPIDSKFPQEDYERLLEAQERGEKSEIDAQSRNIERVILAQAKLISEKYVHPPFSTDFGIMYLPTEGLFAEVVRRPGLASRLQNEFRITVAGPTVLMSLLNSLQLGFRTLAIEQRSSEVWKVLSAAKLEFQKYGQVWAKLEKQLQTAQNTVGEAGRRTRAVERKLREVETIELSAGGQELLDEMFPELDGPDHADAETGSAELAAADSAEV